MQPARRDGLRLSSLADYRDFSPNFLMPTARQEPHILEWPFRKMLGSTPQAYFRSTRDSL